MLDPPKAATIGLFRLINRYLAEPTQQGGQRPGQQASTLRAVGAGISENRNTARNEARPHCRDAAVLRGRDDCCDHGRDGLAATFGARLFAGVLRKKPGVNLVSEQTEKSCLGTD